MKISAAMKDAFRVYSEHFGNTVKFLVVEACFTLAAITPALFLTNEGMKYLAALAVPFYLLLVLWARVNAAAAMRDALNGGNLFSYELVNPEGYGRKLVFGIIQGLKLLLWAVPLIVCLAVAKIHISGETDAFTVMRMIKGFGGGDLMTGIIYLALILLASLILLAAGFAVHSGDRHALVRKNRRLVRGHHGRIMLCWACSLITLLPLIIAFIAAILRYVPVLGDLNAVMMKEAELPSTKITVIILAVGAVLTLPLLPLRSLIPAALVNGLEKE